MKAAGQDLDQVSNIIIGNSSAECNKIITGALQRQMEDRQGGLSIDVGTKMYNSPEQLAGKKYGNRVDIYAVGLIFLELLYPYMESGHEKQKVVAVITLCSYSVGDYFIIALQRC